MQRKLFVPRATKVLLERPAEWEKKREEGNFRGSSRILESVVLVFQKSKYEYLLGLNRILAQQSLQTTKNEKKSMWEKLLKTKKLENAYSLLPEITTIISTNKMPI